ncbi:Zinc finger DNA binding protein [Operophtera brumata]|uniref:Zinc finger DNA binding protein n=1 Tax=Operophtera brumata TaxID=104452 RepID=A0A0L7KQ79_OPEBR|nr:Zinc finger DNA binding protein [Operophtera brumata]
MATQRTPLKTDLKEKGNSEMSQADTDPETDTNTRSRRAKRRAVYSPEVLNSIKLDSTLNSFKLDITEHMTQLFTTFQANQDAKFSTLMTDINVIKQEVKEIRYFNEETEKKINVLSSHYENVLMKSTTLESDYEGNCAKIKHLENKIEDINRQSCAYKIEMRNIPSKSQESTQDLLQIIDAVLKTLKIDAQPTEIRNVRRLPGKPDAPRPIVLELATSTLRNRIIQEARNFNKSNTTQKLNTSHLLIAGSPKPVYIGENLTYRAKGLFFRAREYAKQNNYVFCWTSNGQVYLRKEEGSKSLIVKDEDQLQNLEKGA